MPESRSARGGQRTDPLADRAPHGPACRPREGRGRGAQAASGLGDLDDLTLLREIDDAGRVPGAAVGTVEEALAYVKGLEGRVVPLEPTSDG